MTVRTFCWSFWFNHRLNMALDLQSLFCLLCRVLFGWDPATSPPPPQHLGSHTRASHLPKNSPLRIRRHGVFQPVTCLNSRICVVVAGASVALLCWNLWTADFRPGVDSWWRGAAELRKRLLNCFLGAAELSKGLLNCFLGAVQRNRSSLQLL